MSIRTACSYVPEILLEAPKEVENQTIETRLKDAVAVVFMRTMRVGCIVTVRGGKGVLMKKQADGSWSAPVGLMFGGPALGASIGLEVSNMILFINTEAAMQGLLDNAAGVGLSGGVALGPVGRAGEALLSTASPQIKGAIIIYSSTKGFYGGVNAEFSGILVDKTANAVEYGQDVTPNDILSGQIQCPKDDIFDRMYESLKNVSAAKSTEQATQ